MANYYLDRFIALNLTRSRNKSTVWKHFGFRKNDLSICVCVHCEASLRYCNSTTNLRNHLKNKHQDVFFKVENADLEAEMDSPIIPVETEITEYDTSNGAYPAQTPDSEVKQEDDTGLYEKWKTLRDRYIRSKDSLPTGKSKRAHAYHEFMDTIFGVNPDQQQLLMPSSEDNTNPHSSSCSHTVESDQQVAQENQSALIVHNSSIPRNLISSNGEGNSGMFAVSSSSQLMQEPDEVYYFTMNLSLRLRRFERKKRLKMMNRMENIMFEEEMGE